MLFCDCLVPLSSVLAGESGGADACARLVREVRDRRRWEGEKDDGILATRVVG